MKKENLKISTNRNTNEWVKTCIFNPVLGCDKALEILEKSKTSDEFVKNYLACADVKWTQGWCELVKLDSYMFKKTVKELVRKCDNYLETESDAGSVKIGTDTFSVNISNELGDGITNVLVFEKSFKGLNSLLTFQTTAEGRFNIYDYDCGGTPATVLNGKYGIYARDGVVAFEKW